MCRSSGGKRVARRDTSVVNEDPSGVLVKLKKGTFDVSGWEGVESSVVVLRELGTDRADLNVGLTVERGERVDITCLDDVNVVGVVRSG
jgi:hypothetical protein